MRFPRTLPSRRFTNKSGTRKLRFLLSLVVLISAASGATIYDINFTLTTGTVAPTFGQFTYDSTSQTFSSFTVDWNGGVFDLTASANDPNTDSLNCPGSTATAAFAFAFLSGTGCGSSTLSWFGTPFSSPPNPTGQFRFGPVNAASTQILIGIAPDVGGVQAGGTFSISPASSVPEPAASGMFGLGAMIIIIAAHCKRSTKFRR